MFNSIKLCLTTKSIFVNANRTFSRRIVQPKVIRIVKANESHEKSDNFVREENSFKHIDHGFTAAKHDHKPFENRFAYDENNKKVDNIPRYEKNDRIKNEFSEEIVKAMVNKDDKHTVIFEGKRMINDAIENNLHITHIFFSQKDDLADIKDLNRIVEQEHRTKLIKVTYKEMKMYSLLKTPPGLMAIIKKPDSKYLQSIHQQNKPIPLILICDNVRDPGNMGTIIRTSAAAGIEKVILSHGCVDVWNQKVIKSSGGGIFKIPIITKIKWEDMSTILPDKKLDLYVADVKCNNDDIHASNESYYHRISYFPNNNIDHNMKILIVGNEASGLSTKCLEFIEEFSKNNPNNYHRLKIPLENNSESLNTAIASAILMYEIRRQFELIK